MKHNKMSKNVADGQTKTMKRPNAYKMLSNFATEMRKVSRGVKGVLVEDW